MTNSDILIYQSEDGKTKIQTRLEDETVWLTQKQMSELFQKSKSTINEHIKNVFDEEELNANSVVRNFRTTASDGKITVLENQYFNPIEFDGFRRKLEETRRGVYTAT